MSNNIAQIYIAMSHDISHMYCYFTCHFKHVLLCYMTFHTCIAMSHDISCVLLCHMAFHKSFAMPYISNMHCYVVTFTVQNYCLVMFLCIHCNSIHLIFHWPLNKFTAMSITHTVCLVDISYMFCHSKYNITHIQLCHITCLTS